ncbi:hypothetical protein MM817_03122 [Acidibacillus sp. S0AB]|uniref:Uncharacterized protein n=1 Tax=Sulfoacidibacillus ferrooxidans TaxID=2005001 RepID=A0A9X2AEQ5_9BACL|nr:hypothetical protein [Sulfoacidibacillus ferrooxidans]
MGVTDAGFVEGLYQAKTLGEYVDDAKLLYPVCLALFDRFWTSESVHAVAVG